MCSHLENKVLNDKNNDVKINLTNEENKFYSITNDYVFKKIFTKENNLRYLLNKFFKLKPKKIVIKNKEILKDITSTLKKINESKEEREKMEDIARMMMKETCHYETAYNVGHKEGQQIGISIGEKRGEKRGISQGIENVARNLLKQNIDINVIMNATKLSKNKILSLK